MVTTERASALRWLTAEARVLGTGSLKSAGRVAMRWAVWKRVVERTTMRSELGDGVAEEGDEVVVGDGVGEPSEGAGEVVDEDEGGQCEGGDGAANAEERPPHWFQLLHRYYSGYKPRKARMMMTETTIQAASPPAAMATCGIRMPKTNSGMALGTSIRTQVAEWRSAPRRKMR